MLTVGAGILIGAALAAGLSQLLRTLLFDVKPGDPATVVAMAILIAAAGLAASYLPARRAAAIDPLTALRDE
jgi:ABC-type antimicrobial peptide transport system permease subunit